MTRKQSRRPTADWTDHGCLIPPGELFGRVLYGGQFVGDARLPLEERVEWAWKRMLAGFEENEHDQILQVLVAKIERERHGVTAAKESSP